MSKLPPLVKIYLTLDERIKDSSSWRKAALKGFWLSILTRSQLQTIDRIYYEQTGEYCDESYNKNGFFDWERKAFNLFKALLLFKS